jgi:predicted RNase H-related nuclease YkuK (DUF458 family)
MILTEHTIENMHRLLKSFKKYIEKYECSYSSKNGTSSLTFYHDGTLMPYIMITVNQDSHYPIIYVNYNADNWNNPNCQLRSENLISNDIKKFIEAIRECKASEREVESVHGRA